MSELPPALRARLLRSVADAPAPQGLPWGQRTAVAATGCAVWVGALIAALGPRGEGLRLAPWYALGTLGLVAGSAAVLLGLGLTRGRYLVGPSVERLRWFALVPLVGAAWLAVAAPAVSAAPRSAWTCHWHGLLYGLPILGLLVAVRRGLGVAPSALLGACLGAGAGASVHLLSFVICPDGSATHGLLGHVLPALPLTVLGGVLGHRWLRG